MSSAISTREDDPRPRSFPRRAVLAILLLLAAALYTVTVFPPRIRQFAADQRESYLPLADMAAIAVELRWSADAMKDPQLLAAETVALFEHVESLAFVRLRNRAQQVICEIPRLDANRALVRPHGEFPNLGAAKELKTLQARLDTIEWLRPIADLQTVLLDQGDLVLLMEEAVNAGRTDETTRNNFYSQQDLTCGLAQALTDTHPLVADAVDEMEQAMETLTHDDADALLRAIPASSAAEGSLALALESHRALAGGRVALPASIQKLAPAPSSLPARLWPAVRGYRVLIPLFLPDTGNELAEHVGYAEVVFYAYPADAFADAVPLAIPPLALLLIVLALPFIRPRKPKMTDAEDPNHLPAACG